MNIGILGGGFGLYGYLPAIITAGIGIPVLPKRYLERLLSRDDLRLYKDKVIWVENEVAVLKACHALILCLTPTRQVYWAHQSVAYPNIQYIFLEKPLALLPVEATQLLLKLKHANKKVGVGYNFRFTPWAKSLLEKKCGVNVIEWFFQAHHYANQLVTWKRQHHEGGGALRFYGIHLIALLAEMGYSTVLSSELFSKQLDDVEEWSALIESHYFLPCRVIVRTNSSTTCFRVIDNTGEKTELKDPFDGVSTQDKNDRRVGILIQALIEFFDESIDLFSRCQQVNTLWESCEKVTRIPVCSESF